MSTASPSRPSPPLHPVGLRLHSRPVVVVGGGAGALRATAGLLDAGALVTVVSPAVVPALEALAGAGSLSWIPRGYAPGDLDAAWYAVAATGDDAVDRHVAADAERARVFCTSTGDPDASSAFRVLSDGADALPRDGRRGRVVLVGGGPGDPGLITVRGRQALAQADVVVVDHLGPRSLLAGLRRDVEIVDASKLPRGRAMPQEEINRLLVRHAREGRLVVRLKGGDPFVFGRGMEELLACAAADVPVEVVPGVTSAIAVPGVAGIPVTHRGLTHEFVVVSGHLPPGHPQSLVDWSAVGRLRGTVVVLMGVENAAAIAVTLIASGRPAATPVAVVVEGTTGRERTVRTTLADLGHAMAEHCVQPPAVWVVGEVVQLSTGTARGPGSGDGQNSHSQPWGWSGGA
ncbi:uroporphyrin-III C-methyltransferase / precorrin-2 dehydrogenase / sirohydrochlorin ferrochelatase [Blastococcus aggregatus]|uniref:uroporphyrinogen-III C-methyltransferase n=1 Tax=Blastococcus aggregatus TaxID=38502 RepID=A0A285V055_9ACTN|nr:uroporphyrinogen-III C-methyltransferase [Blastococcus aggregatus]SOC46376.1 uroporphyrin-III C-methyltransferase / precorrin-2 dehydrogenase / sirohydrochlorin ferrochelatase [Blastococcus aggregatus]